MIEEIDTYEETHDGEPTGEITLEGKTLTRKEEIIIEKINEMIRYING
jgi:hypothetical protein